MASDFCQRRKVAGPLGLEGPQLIGTMGTWKGRVSTEHWEGPASGFGLSVWARLKYTSKTAHACWPQGWARAILLGCAHGLEWPDSCVLVLLGKEGRQAVSYKQAVSYWITPSYRIEPSEGRASVLSAGCSTKLGGWEKTESKFRTCQGSPQPEKGQTTREVAMTVAEMWALGFQPSHVSSLGDRHAQVDRADVDCLMAITTFCS